jgi:CRP-like cAMP-binding protein
MSVQIHTLEPVLKANPFFEGIDGRLLDLLVGCATNLRFDTGQYIFHEEAPADRFYIIRHGVVSLELGADRESVTIETLRDGHVLGWSWLFEPYVWQFSARARELTRVIAMDAECIRAKSEENNELGYELMKRFALVVVDRLQATRHRLLELQGGDSAKA